MNVYSIDVNIVATAYIQAESEELALAKAQEICGEFLEFSDRHQSIGDDICMDGGSYRGLWDNEETVAFSPAMTICQQQDFSLDGLDMVEEDIDVEEAEDEDA